MALLNNKFDIMYILIMNVSIGFKVLTRDQLEFVIPIAYIPRLLTLNNMLECITSPIHEDIIHEDIIQDPILLDSISLQTLKIVCEFCELQDSLKDVFIDTMEISETQQYQNWSEKFFDKYDMNIFSDIINAADFLDFQELYKACIFYHKQFLISHTPEEIREQLNLPDDLTMEEKKEINQIGLYVLRCHS